MNIILRGFGVGLAAWNAVAAALVLLRGIPGPDYWFQYTVLADLAFVLLVVARGRS